MTWLTWRQFRTNALVGALALTAIAIVLGFTNRHGTGYLSHDHLVEFLDTALVAVPAIIGAFWGAPLIAREIETGTYRLAWTQGVTRTRWLTTKVALVGLAGVGVTGLWTLMLTHWSSPALNADRFSTAMFGERGIAPMGYAAFGFALGVAAGTILRRTLPAMASTLVVFLAIRIAFAHLVRPLFATPLKLTQALASQPGGPGLQAKAGSWTLSSYYVNGTGQVTDNPACHQSPTTFRGGPGAVPPRRGPASLNASGRAAQQCIAQFREVLRYQPASRYWAFQAYETAIFAALAAILVACTLWWIRYRLT